MDKKDMREIEKRMYSLFDQRVRYGYPYFCSQHAGGRIFQIHVINKVWPDTHRMCYFQIFLHLNVTKKNAERKLNIDFTFNTSTYWDQLSDYYIKECISSTLSNADAPFMLVPEVLNEKSG